MINKELLQYQHKYRGYDFKDKKRGEDIILVLRRHWLIFIFQFAPIVAGALVLIGSHFFIMQYFRDTLGTDGRNILFFTESLLAMFLWMISFIFWVDYYFDVWIITTHRIVDIEQIGLFRRNISELECSKVQDVTTEIHGILQTLLDYGVVYVQTAGKKSRFIFKQVPNPSLVRELVIKLQKTNSKNNL